MKYKRGSHIGVILSFIIFITFLVFLYSVLQPSLKIKEDKEKLLDNLKVELTQKFSSDVEIITFVINVTTSNTCVRLEDLVDQLNNQNFIIKNESGGIINSVGKNNGDLLINRSDLDDNFFKVYNSPEFSSVGDGGLSGCEVILNNSYSFKSAASGGEIILSLINKTKNEYDANYTSLKEKLNMPLASNFGFFFTDRKTIIIETENKNVSTSVYAEEIPVLYVDSEANINPGFLAIRVW